MTFLFQLSVYAQEIQDHSDYSNKNQYDSIFRKSNSVKPSILLAKQYFKNRNFKSAIELYENAKSDSESTASERFYAMYYLGYCYLGIGEVDSSRNNLTDCLLLNITDKQKKAISGLIFKLGLDEIYNDWKVMETSHFIFHFQNATDQDIAELMFKKEVAFDSINRFFNVNLPKKIDYYVWNDNIQAKKLMDQSLAFTYPELCITHTSFNFTLGHEMTHSIIHFAAKSKIKNKLITEGTCVYFDMGEKWDFNAVRKKADSTISVVEVWKYPLSTTNRILYPLGGELVSRLIGQFGMNKFLELLVDQSYENAQRIYGKKLNKLIDKLQEDLLPDYTN